MANLQHHMVYSDWKENATRNLKKYLIIMQLTASFCAL